MVQIHAIQWAIHSKLVVVVVVDGVAIFEFGVVVDDGAVVVAVANVVAILIVGTVGAAFAIFDLVTVLIDVVAFVTVGALETFVAADGVNDYVAFVIVFVAVVYFVNVADVAVVWCCCCNYCCSCCYYM